MCSDGDWIPRVTQSNTSCRIWFAGGRKKTTTEWYVQRGAKALKSVSVERAVEGRRRKREEFTWEAQKRRTRSTERTKKGVSELLFGSVGAYVWAKWVLALGAPWVLAELESSVSQSKQQFWILGLVNDDKETSYLWSGLLAVWWCRGRGWSWQELGWTRGWDPSRRAVPPPPGAEGHSPVFLGTGGMSHCNAKLSLWALICHQCLTHTSLNRN